MVFIVVFGKQVHAEAWFLVRPCPAVRLRQINAVFICVVAAFDLFVQHLFFHMRARHMQSREAVDDIGDQAEAVDLVLDRQFQRRVMLPFSL